MTPMRARQLAVASIGLGTVTVWLALLGLITTPYLIHRLGVAFYGIFALITIMSAYLSNLELGFGHATVRFLARARAEQDAIRERAVIETSFAVFLGAAIAATSIALAGSGFVADKFVHGEAARGDVALDAIRIGAVILFLSLLTSFAAAALQALGRFRLLVATRGIFGTLASAGAVTAVALGGGVRSVLAVTATLNAILCVTQLVALGRASSVSLRPRVHTSTLRSMGRYGSWVLVSGLLFQATMQAPPTILAANATTDQLAAFAVPNTILLQLVALVAATSFGFVPFASAESASADRTYLREVFRANLRMTVLTAGPIVSYMALFGEPLMAEWIDPEFADDAIGPLRFLAFAAWALALSAPPADVLRGLGRPRWIALFTLAAATCTVGGALALVSAHGAAGVAAALLGGLTAATVPLMVIVADRCLGMPPVDLLRGLSGPVCAVASCAAIFAAGTHASSGFGGAIAAGAIGTSVYVVVAARFVLDSRERDVFRSLLPRRAQTSSTGPEEAA